MTAHQEAPAERNNDLQVETIIIKVATTKVIKELKTTAGGGAVDLVTALEDLKVLLQPKTKKSS